MAVIPFPLSSTRLRPCAALDPEAVDALTHQDFFQVIQTDAESGAAVISQEDEARLVQYLEFHGLRLPSAVKADQLRELCNTLRWTYGPAVRLAARNGSALAKECPGLSADKIAYACTVAGQQHGLTREMARQVLKGRASLVFFY
ncbi:MAG: hypothetical protein AB7S86_04280 [Hydrogenophaga sp.]|uniref:hypothetical protein n=1 Tax=Hydrogenophaga sp. TaxID=1904254 RepID=UPI003D10AC4E